MIEFPTLSIVCCYTTFEKCNHIQKLLQKLLNKFAMHAVILLLLHSRKFWRYVLLFSSMLLDDVIMTSYCCQDRQIIW